MGVTKGVSPFGPMDRPQDLLEFLRRHDTEEEAAPPEQAQREPAPGTIQGGGRLTLTQRQLQIAGVMVALGLALAFLLGMAFGGSGPEPAAVGPAGNAWVIRAISYPDVERQMQATRETESWLNAQGLGQATMIRIRSKEQLVVVLGAWLEDPSGDPAVQRLLKRVRNLDWKGKKPFDGAYIWQIALR